MRPQFPAAARRCRRACTASSTRPACAVYTKAGQGNDKILIGETSPRGTGRVVAPLAFMRGMLCLNAKYKRVGKCGALTADGYAHHAYTTKQGPFFAPPSKDDVTIGVLTRLTRALDRAERAGALTSILPIYLTEFGIQSTPDTVQGVSLAKQVEYRAISERIAYANTRVVSFSQYLLRDSDATGTNEYGGFESGLRFADGKPKPSLQGFRLPLAVQRRGSRASVWGLVRPASGATSATITYANRGSSKFLPLRTVQTNAFGYFSFATTYVPGRRWNITWQNLSGSPVGAYTR